MSKAEQIKRLYAHGIFTTSEIAKHVGCDPAYVRVVARQRTVAGKSVADRRYIAANLDRVRKRNAERMRKRNSNPEYRAKNNENRRRRYQEDPFFRDALKERKKRWVQENRARKNAYQREWSRRRKDQFQPSGAEA